MGWVSWLILGISALFILFMTTVIRVVLKNKDKDDTGAGSMGLGKGPPDRHDLER